MELLRAYSEDIYSYSNMELGFIYSGGVTLILGKDLKLKTSNGSGKTTLLKIIYYLIYGEDLNGSNKDSIPNRLGDGSYYGYIILKEQGHEFKIERMDKRKDKHPTKSSSPCVNFYIDDQLFMTTSEKRNSITEIQTSIQSKIKMSPRLFTSAIISKRNSNKNFLLANDTEKKDILSEILDLIVYGKAFELVKKDIIDIEKRRRDKVIKLETYKNQILDYRNDIKEQEELSLNYNTEKDEKIKAKNVLLGKEKRKFVDIKSKIVKIENLEGLNNQKNELESRSLVLSDSLKDEVEIGKEISKLESEIEALEKEIKNIKIQEVNQFFIASLFVKKGVKEDEKIISLDVLESLFSKNQKDIMDLELANHEIALSFPQDISSDKHLSGLKLKDNDLKNELRQIQKDIVILENDKNELDNSETCPTCLRDYDNEHKKEHIQPKIDSKTKEIKLLKNKIISLNKEQSDVQLEIVSLSQNIEVFNENSRKIKYIQELNNYVYGLVINEIKEIDKNNESNTLLRSELNIKLSNLKETLESKVEANSKFKTLKEEFILVQSELKNLESKINESKTQSKLNEQYASEMKSVVDNGKQIEKEIEDIKNSENPYLKMIDSLNTKIKGIEEQTKALEKSIALDDEELHYLKFWQIGFSPSGIRSFISDDLIDLLNQKVQENLNDLYDGALNILFESESEDSKGVTVNKISTNCFLDGKEVEISTLSDGQLNRAVLATDLALMEVAESRSGTWLNVKFLDEPCANMDSAGQLQAFKLFNKLAKQKDGFFVISHDESFQSMCANTIHVLRQNGQSRLVTKEEFKKYSSDNVEENNIFEHKSNKVDVKSSDFLKEIVFKKKERKEEED